MALSEVHIAVSMDVERLHAPKRRNAGTRWQLASRLEEVDGGGEINNPTP